VLEIDREGEARLREPSILGDLTLGALPDEMPAVASLPEPAETLNRLALRPFLDEVRDERVAEVERIAAHVDTSLTELLARADQEIGRAHEDQEQGIAGAEGRLAQAENRHAELLARRERRREELARQRALTLQSVERLASALVLPHPERAAPEVARLRPNPETERIAMETVINHERSLGRQVFDISEKNLGYDVTSLDLESGELRLIEVKGLAAETGVIRLTPNEKRVAEDRRDCYWLYVVTNCADSAVLQAQITHPASLDWHEVKQVAHYYLSVNALSRPIVFSEPNQQQSFGPRR
jgi:flagellar motility protein MotE (MotC chaperone)